MHRRAQHNLSRLAAENLPLATTSQMNPHLTDLRNTRSTTGEVNSTRLVSTLVGQPGPSASSTDIAQRFQRHEHMTNFELERLFALTTAPAAAAAMRFGGVLGAAAANRLRDALTAQRQSNSEGYLRNWDRHDSSNVVTIRTEPEPPQQHSDAQRVNRANSALRALPVHYLSSPIDGDPCAICQQFMCKGEAIRRLPCAHIFHADCISKWLHVRLTCPFDNLPVDEGLEMLAAAATSNSTESLVIEEDPEAAQASSPGVVPLPPPSDPPPLPPSDSAPPPPTESPASASPSAIPPVIQPPCLPPLGLRELQAAADGAGVSAERLADALAHRRSVQMQLHQLQLESGGAPIVLE